MTATDTAAAAIAERDWTISVGGRALPATARADVEDPATGQVITTVPDCSPEDVDRVVRAAAEAQRAWGLLPARARGTKVREFAAALRANATELATLDAVDAGFTLPVMLADVEAAAILCEIMADHALALGGTTYPLSGNLHYSLNQPYGVVGRIIPFNHPLFFAAGKVAAPLVAGNTVVLKAPDQTPLTALRMAELAADVFGPDLCTVITGRGAVSGQALVQHPLVKRIGFIGAPETGRLIQREAAEAGVKYVSLELGGKNALIVMPDADLARAADSAVSGMNYTATAGQSCGSTSRLLLHESVAEQVLENVVEQVRVIRVGHPLAEGTQMGPVIDRKQYDKSIDTIGEATAAGAAVLAGGGRPDTVGPDGYYVAPTVLGRMNPDNPAAVREIFGPVLSALTFRDEAEAVRIANQSEFGLTAGVWTSDVTRAHRMAAQLEAGYVWVNGSSRHYWGLPFGGLKGSGIGREESVDELLSYTETKAVTVVLD
jgi:2-formylbenzoate dehydrogenase